MKRKIKNATMTSKESIQSCKQFSQASKSALIIQLCQLQRRLRPVHQSAKLDPFVSRVEHVLLDIQLAKIRLKVCIHRAIITIFTVLKTHNTRKCAPSWMFISNLQEIILRLLLNFPLLTLWT